MSIDNHELPARTIQELRTANAPRVYRPHTTTRPKTFDWDALTPTCSSCSTRTGTVNTTTGLCATCDPTRPAPAPPRPTRRRTTSSTPKPSRAAYLDVPAITDAYTSGQSINSIARALHVSPNRIRAALLKSGTVLRTDDHRRGRPRNPNTVRPTPRRTLDEAAIVAAYQAGQSAPQIARTHHCSPPLIRRILDRHGIERRDDRATRSGGKRITRDPEFIARVHDLYITQNLTQSQVAKIIGCSEKVIWRTIRDTPGLEPHPSATALSAAGIGRPIKIQPHQQLEIVARWHAGENGPSLARTYSCSAAAIYAVLRKNGVPTSRAPRTGAA